MWRFRSAGHHVEFMRCYYGPLNRAFGTLDEEQQQAFEGDLISLVEGHNRSGDGTAMLATPTTWRWSRPDVETKRIEVKLTGAFFRNVPVAYRYVFRAVREPPLQVVVI